LVDHRVRLFQGQPGVEQTARDSDPFVQGTDPAQDDDSGCLRR
jgi:hypothetical protein